MNRTFEFHDIELLRRSEYFADVVSQDSPFGRHYSIACSDGSQLRFPSLTTVLGATKNKDWLEKWQKRVGREESERVRNAAANRGTSLHNLVEHYLKTGEVSSKESPRAHWLFEKIKSKLDEHIGLVGLVEVPLFSKLLRTAGRVDIIAEWDKVWSVVDIKSSTNPKEPYHIEDYYLQETGYATMACEVYKIPPIKQIVTLMAVENSNHLTGAAVYIEQTDDHIRPLVKRVLKYHKEYSV
jgi:hypothetical protein